MRLAFSTGARSAAAPATTPLVTSLWPFRYFVAPRERTRRAVETIKEELGWYRSKLEGEGKLLEAQRLHQRTMFDLEMIKEIGYCHGIENYARHLTGRAPGEPPPTLLDYLPSDALIVVDESHQSVPQVRGMNGAVNDLRALITAISKDPKKYLNVKVSIF